jgi:E3 ubiquitin-protein ligase SHPRH
MSELTNDIEQKDRFRQGEDHAYDSAEKYRMELLSETREGVARAVKATEEISVVSCELEEMETTTPFDNWGLKTRRIFEQVQAGIQLLNQNAEVVLSWRRAARKALFTPVNREVSADNADDDQYAEALECQHQAEVLLEMYRPLLARRQAILTSQIANGSMELPNSMKDLESSVRFSKQQRRQALLRGGPPSVAHAVQETDLDVLAEHERAQLAQYRLLAEEMNKASVTQLHDSRSLADLLPRLREISEEEGGSLQEDRLAQEGVLALRAILKRQSRLLEGLRRELDVMAKLFNRRAEYVSSLAFGCFLGMSSSS